ncbi:hypothetical protein N7454_005689 [Penicillium verhagenii]|nr:hypothetical protein N7454_005689 [Penicillium verhagenii]
MFGSNCSQIECVKRDIGHLCMKDERNPRAKRMKTSSSHEKTILGSPILETTSIDAEETVQALEDFIEGTSNTNNLSSAFAPISSTPAPDYPNLYWATTETQLQNERLSLIREIIDAFPDSEMVQNLHQIFVTRCQGPLGNIFHTPTFMNNAAMIRECLNCDSRDSQVLAISSSFSMETLACFLMALVLGLAFHPAPNVLGWIPTDMNERVEALRSSNFYSSMWKSLALRCLRGRMGIFCASVASLQASLMLLLDGQQDYLDLDSLLVTAISGAQKLGLHRLGDVKLILWSHSSGHADMPSHIRTEVGIRIWWALLLRDWSRGHALGYYTIRPSQFNTRMPLHINDDDMDEFNNDHFITERPRSEFTMLSYTVHALEIAALVRESVDLRNSVSETPHQKAEALAWKNELNKKYEKLLIELPSHFQPGSIVGLTSTGPLAAAPVQQWMLQQQLWGLFLRLYRGNMSLTSRSTCKILAQNIISSSAQVQTRCTVCGTLSISDVQSSMLLPRVIAKDKIQEAIELLRARADSRRARPFVETPSQGQSSSTQRSIIVLETLMKLAQESTHDERRTWDTGKSLKSKVMGLLPTFLQGSKTSMSSAHGLDFFTPENTIMSLSDTSGGGFGDLDVLPMLSNDLNCDFWQFLDLSPDNLESQQTLQDEMLSSR